MTTHTPGPWTHRPSDHEEGCIYEIRGPFLNGISLWVGGAETIADARLIAASPDLLHAACEAIEEIAYWHRDYLVESEPHPRGNGWLRVHQLLADAIRKATGAQP